MTNLQDIQYIFNVRTDVTDAVILLNGIEKGYTPNTFTISLSELQSLGGTASVLVNKTLYGVNEEYRLVLATNPNFDPNTEVTNSRGTKVVGTGDSADVVFTTNPDVYSNTQQYIIAVQKYVNGVLDRGYTTTADTGNYIDLNFTLFPITEVRDETNRNGNVLINLDGDLLSAKLIVNGTEISVSNGDNYTFALGSDIVVVTSDINAYRIVQLSTTSNGVVVSDESTNESKSLQRSFILDGDYVITIKTERSTIVKRDLPKIEFINPNLDKNYNINSKTHFPIGIRKIGIVERLIVYVNGIEISYDDLGLTDEFIILIPNTTFTTVGKYEVEIVPFNSNGKGESLNLIINAIDEYWVGIPDIINITYPSIIQGADFVGTNVDFEIAWESINTDYIRISKLNGTSFTKAPATGNIVLNIQTLISLDGGIDVSESDEQYSIVLKLVPYNESGDKVLTGVEEIITIKFSKGSLDIPRPTAINRIADAFFSQFEESIFNANTSKYLTHLMHVGDGDNKVITTWTGSYIEVEESGERLNALIIKLYEPLPTSIQPNQQIWLSKLQSNPIIETITISGDEGDLCSPLKGPNFSIDVDNGIGYKIYEELIATGSQSSNTLVNNYLSKLSIDTTDLHIEYKSGSTYLWENFVNFGSAEELINNFVYKVNLIQNYESKYISLTETDGSESDWTSSIQILNEATKISSSIQNIKNEFSGFEKFLYESDNIDFNSVDWEEPLIVTASLYDKNNVNYLVNNIPNFIVNDSENADFILFLDMIGTHFDLLWMYINKLSKIKELSEKSNVGILNQYIWNILKSFGWDARRAYDSEFLWEYAFGLYKDGTQKYSTSLEDANNQIWRRILNNLPYLLKNKGTSRAMKVVMACYGVPNSLLDIVEYGGPVNPTETSTINYTYEDRSYAVNLQSSSKIIVPWKVVSSDYPQSIEFRFKPALQQDFTILSGSNFSLSIDYTTESLGRVVFDINGNSSQSLEIPISSEDYSSVLVNKTTSGINHTYNVYYKTSNGERIYTTASVEIETTDDWGSGNYIYFGNNFSGSIDEIRLWSIPLEETHFINHTLFPDAINGNSYTASTSDLVFRLDFESVKDLTATSSFTNVAVNSSLYNETFATASAFYSASTYPYQYVSYDRTVTAVVPSFGFNYSNKIRFENQTSIFGGDLSNGVDLSYKNRVTKKSFDNSPIDSNKLGIFLSPNKELNLDIIKTFGSLNIDNYIGNPSDEYKDEYTDLNNLREYYFERIDRNINEYINLVKYINKSLFDVLADLAPARAKVAKGLLIEPHLLERSKVKWNKPTSETSNHITSMSVDIDIVGSDLVENAELNIDDTTSLVGETPMYETDVQNLPNNELESEYPTYMGVYDTSTDFELTGSYPTYDSVIDYQIEDNIITEVDAIGSFNSIGLRTDTIANGGFGLYAENGVAVYKSYDSNGNYTEYRSRVYLLEKNTTKLVKTQTAGYPTIGASPGEQIVYENIPTTFTEYSVNILPFSASVPSEWGSGVTASLLNGYFGTHYKNVNNLSEGLIRSFWKGSQQTQDTTPDSLPPVEVFATNANVLRVTKTGRSSGDPILEVD